VPPANRAAIAGSRSGAAAEQQRIALEALKPSRCASSSSEAGNRLYAAAVTLAVHAASLGIAAGHFFGETLAGAHGVGGRTICAEPGSA